MRKAEFHVPVQAMPEFVMEMTDRALNNTIKHVTEDDEIVVEVEYDQYESEIVDELEEILEKLVEEIQQEEEE